MGVDLRRAHVLVAEQFLNGTDVVAVLERALGRQPAEEAADLWRAHLRRVAFLMEEDVTPDPLDVGIFGTQAVVPDTQLRADLVKQAWLVHGDLPVAGC